MVKFSIFQRINTTGVTLKSQEIRHALHQGIPTDFVEKLAESALFKSATCGVLNRKRMEDRDYVTRFIAFYLLGYENYEPDLNSFLNYAMIQLGETEERQRKDMEMNFYKSMTAAQEIFGEHAFRKIREIDKREPINKAVFEIWSVNLANLREREIKELVNRRVEVISSFQELINTNSDFNKSVSSATGSSKNVQIRFTTVKNLIQSFVL